MTQNPPDALPLALATRLVHAHASPHAHHGAVASPIYQSATFLSNPEQHDASYQDIVYARLGNTPNHVTLHRRIADVEGAQQAFSFSSGMAAISTTLMALLDPGDHLLASDELYGATHQLLSQHMPRCNVEVTRFDPRQSAAELAALVRPNTRAIYLEAMSNPLLKLPDFDAILTVARQHDLLSIVDNTFCSPINFRPIEHGFSLGLHSATKYLNGHSDVIAGCVFGEASLVERIVHRTHLQGACLDPHAAVLLERGMKTLALRVTQQNANALALARELEAHAARHDSPVRRVYYPGLESSSCHATASRYFDGYGGVLSFELEAGDDETGGTARALKLVNNLALAHYAPSLGGVESLVTLPVLTSHSTMSAQEREALGISSGLVRLSLGIEDTNDLRRDLLRALDAI